MDVTVNPVVSGVTLAIVEGMKATGLPGRWAFIFSLVVATILTVLYEISTMEGEITIRLIAVWIFNGIAAGAVASGLYSGVRAVTKG